MVYTSQIQQLQNYQGPCCVQIFVSNAQNYKKGARITLFISVSAITGKLNIQTQQPLITNVPKKEEEKNKKINASCSGEDKQKILTYLSWT